MSANAITNKQQIYNFIEVSWIELLISGVVLMFIILKAVVDVLVFDLALSNYVDSFFGAISSYTEKFTQSVMAANIVTALFWAVMGLIIYSLCWTLVVMVMDVRSDILISQYFFNNKSFHQSSFWLASVSRRVVATTLFIVIVIYGFLLIKGLPIVFNSIVTLISDGIRQAPTDISATMILVGSWLLGWHLLVVIRRVFAILYRKIK